MVHIIHVQIHVKRTKFFETANRRCILAALSLWRDKGLVSKNVPQNSKWDFPIILVVGGEMKLSREPQLASFRCRAAWRCVFYRRFSPIKGITCSKMELLFMVLLIGMSFESRCLHNCFNLTSLKICCSHLYYYYQYRDTKIAGNCASIVSERTIWSMTSNILNLLGLQNLNYTSSLSAALFEVWLLVRGAHTAYEGERDVPRIDLLYCIWACGNLSSTLQIDRTFKLHLTAHQRPITLLWNWSQL